MAGDKQSQQANQTSTAYTSTVDSRQVNTSDSNNTNTYTQTIDGGAILGALDLAKAVAAGANASTAAGYDFSGRTLDSALDFAGKNDVRAFDAYDNAANLVSSALGTVTKQSGAVIDQLQNAYADAKGTSQSQQQVILGVLAVAAIIAFSAFRGRA